MFGPPGSGKGTQSRLISQWLEIPSVSTGDLLRSVAKSDSSLGRALAARLAAGEYASDDMVNQIVVHYLDNLDAGGVILDGYPRTVQQAAFLDEAMIERGMPRPIAIQLDVPVDIIVERLSARRQCAACRRIYNLLEQPPAAENQCDDGCGPLTRRDDDVPAVIRDRLATYDKLTAPVLDHYRAGPYLCFNGNLRPEAVFQAIRTALPQAGT
jgi:adenylate kinase